MRIGILIFSKPRLEGTTGSDALAASARALGHRAIKLHEPFFTLGSRTGLLYENKPLPKLDVLIARPNFCEEPWLHTSVLRELEKSVPRVLNRHLGMTQTKNKLIQHAMLTEAGIPMPIWEIARTPALARESAKRIGYPCIIKVAYGTLGAGVFFANNAKTLGPIVDYLNIRDHNPVIIQKFIPPMKPNARASDIRAFVVGDEVIAAMKREAAEDDIRANIGRGGTGRKVSLTKEEQKLAVDATRVFHLDIAGVNLLRSKQGPLIIEVNSNPGFEELQKATGINVAKKIIQEATK